MNSIKKNPTTFNVESNIRKELTWVTPNIRSFSLKLTGNKSDANDLFQETVLRIICNAEKFKNNTNFKAWAMTIMRNLFINDYRRKRIQATNFDSTSNNFYLNSGYYSIENKGETKMAYKELLKMVSGLPEIFQRPFWMSYTGYKYQEISEELNTPVGTIKSRIFFARRKLQTMYQQKEIS
jgi:RNA polymerase sigma-70 factor (ECF subfamily)